MKVQSVYLTMFNEELKEVPYLSNSEFMEDQYRYVYAYLLVAAYLQEDPSKESYMEFINQLIDVEDHISNRLRNTPDTEEYPLYQLIKKDNMTEFEVFCVLLGGLKMYAPKCEELLEYIIENARRKFPIRAFAYYLYTSIKSLIDGNRMITHSEKFYILYFEQTNSLGEYGFLEPLILRRSVYDYLLHGALFHSEYENCTVYDRCDDALCEVLIYKEEAARLFVYLNEVKEGIVSLVGEHNSGRTFLIRELAKKHKKGVVFADYEQIKNKDDINECILQIYLESKLKEGYICITNCPDFNRKSGNEAKEEREQFGLILRELTKWTKQFFVVACESVIKESSDVIDTMEILLKRPDIPSKMKLWDYFLEEYDIEEDINSEYLGSRYVLNAGEIKKVLRTTFLNNVTKGKHKIAKDELLNVVRMHNANRLGGFAESIESHYTWDDLVVDEHVQKQLMYICGRITYKNLVEEVWGFGKKSAYGKGVCALFYGPPGTGKTMAVQVIAQEMGLEVYRVDLSRMLSKYIGETQKHITELFDKAKNMNILLFFDEADAFFHKRTQISDSNDKNANGEVAHLLQKLEEYEGVSILATNLKDNIDNAFKRRIKYMVHFQAPDGDARNRLFKKQFPTNAPTEPDLDIDFFAQKFEMSGSEIKDIVLNAAFIAAKEKSAIGNRHLIDAIKINFEKYGRILTKDDFITLKNSVV